MGQVKPEENQAYRSFMLRMWREAVDGCHTWRFSLEDPFTGKR
jgi:hypothetical protein